MAAVVRNRAVSSPLPVHCPTPRWLSPSRGLWPLSLNEDSSSTISCAHILSASISACSPKVIVSVHVRISCRHLTLCLLRCQLCIRAINSPPHPSSLSAQLLYSVVCTGCSVFTRTVEFVSSLTLAVSTPLREMHVRFCLIASAVSRNTSVEDMLGTSSTSLSALTACFTCTRSRRRRRNAPLAYAAPLTDADDRSRNRCKPASSGRLKDKAIQREVAGEE